MADELAVIGFAAILGALMGSFLNVCILRLPKDQSVVRPRSRCPGCGQAIAWYDNVPIVSWLILRARCRRCGEPISWQYPLVELTTAVLWGWMLWRYGLSIEALRASLFFTILLGIALTDAREYIIPDEFSVGGLVIGLLLSLTAGAAGFGDAVLGAAVGFALLWLVGDLGKRVFKEEAMGGGDIKMMAMVGAFVGWKGVLLTVFLGAVLGTVVFVPLSLLASTRRAALEAAAEPGRRLLVPFGVFLAIGAAITYLAGDAVLGWYYGFLTAG